MRQGGACVPRHPVAPSSAHAAKAPRCVRAPCSSDSMLASAVGWLRRIGVIIPFAVALMIGGAVLVAHAVWMHAKALLAQILLELRQAAANDVRVAAHMEAGVVARGLDPIDVRDIHKQQPARRSDDEPLGRLRLQRPIVRELVLGAA